MYRYVCDTPTAFQGEPGEHTVMIQEKETPGTPAKLVVGKKHHLEMHLSTFHSEDCHFSLIPTWQERLSSCPGCVGYQAVHLKGKKGADATTGHVVPFFPFFSFIFTLMYRSYMSKTQHKPDGWFSPSGKVLSKWKERSHSSVALSSFHS